MQKKYDVIIIGAGISGLVCGCYLVKAGLRVLIVEKNEFPGGWCTSIKFGQHRFNLGITSFSNYFSNSKLKLMFEELGVASEIGIQRINPANRIITSEYNIKVGTQLIDINRQFQVFFPKEKRNVENFFYYVTSAPIFTLYRDLRDSTYSDLLSKYFCDIRLRSLLCFFLGSIGMRSSELSALSAVLVLREFIIFGGNFLMNDFVDVIPISLMNAFLREGGDISFSEKIDKIIVRHNTVSGVRVAHKLIDAKVLIATCDPTYTFKYLINNDDEQNLVNAMKLFSLSNSAFVLYLRIKKEKIAHIREPNLWICSNCETMDDIPSVIGRSEIPYQHGCVFVGLQSRYNQKLSSPEWEYAFSIVNAEYKSPAFWEKEATILRDFLIRTIALYCGIQETDIATIGFITPVDLARLTNNSKGAMRGWASTAAQNSKSTFSSKSTINNLYFAGQWVSNNYVQGGIVMSAINGKDVANDILKMYFKERKVILCN